MENNLKTSLAHFKTCSHNGHHQLSRSDCDNGRLHRHIFVANNSVLNGQLAEHKQITSGDENNFFAKSSSLKSFICAINRSNLGQDVA